MKKWLFAALFWLAATVTCLSQGTIPVALTQQVDANGRPLAEAQLFTFVAGTVAQQQITFQDVGLTIPNPWPLVADQNGRIPFFYLPSGSVHVRLTDAFGNPQFDIPTMLVIGSAGGGGGGSSVDPTTIASTGDEKVRYGIGAISGWVRENGLAIGNATSGATERANSDTQNLFIYLYTTDPNLAVSGGRTGNALSDYNANKTIATPDMRGLANVGLADMGNSPTSVLIQTYAQCNSGVTTLGALCGSQNQVITQPNLPAVAPTFTGSPSTLVIDSNNAVTQGGSSGGGFSSGGTFPTFPVATITGHVVPQGTISNLGIGAPLATILPIKLKTFYIKL